MYRTGQGYPKKIQKIKEDNTQHIGIKSAFMATNEFYTYNSPLWHGRQKIRLPSVKIKQTTLFHKNHIFTNVLIPKTPSPGK